MRQIIRIGVRGGKITGEGFHGGKRVLHYGQGAAGGPAHAGHEGQGTAHDPKAAGYEAQGREAATLAPVPAAQSAAGRMEASAPATVTSPPTTAPAPAAPPLAHAPAPSPSPFHVPGQGAAGMEAHRGVLHARLGLTPEVVAKHKADLLAVLDAADAASAAHGQASKRLKVARSHVEAGDVVSAWAWTKDALATFPATALAPAVTKRMADLTAAMAPIRDGIRGYALARVADVRAAARKVGLACLEAEHPKVRAACKAGDELWLRSLELGEGLIRAFDTTSKITYRVRKGGDRAYYRWSGTYDHLVKMGADYNPSGGGTLRHELSHAVEHAAPDLGQTAEAWRDAFAARTNGGKLELAKLAEFDPNYDPSEKCYRGAFFNPYVARKYDFPGSEVLSMGVEFIYMAKDPEKMQMRHFEHFALVDWAFERALAAHKAAGNVTDYTTTLPATA